MKNKVWFIVSFGVVALAALFFFVNVVQNRFSVIYSFDILDQQRFDKDTLVIFDIDRVLLIETDPYERGHRAERKKTNTVSALFAKDSAIAQSLDQETRNALWTIYARDLEESLIDESLPAKIKSLQQQGVKVIALTRFMAGKAGAYDAVETMRTEKLRSVGIDFGLSFPDNPVVRFAQFINRDGRSPIFRDGVLFTSFACAKGELLLAFFKAINWRPNRVIMFDDKRDNLVSVQRALAQINVPFTGYCYKKASQLSELFDKKGAQLQMRYLLDHGQWLSLQQLKKV